MAATPGIRGLTADMPHCFAFIENNLLRLAVLTVTLGLLVSSVGIAPEAGISPVLALLILVISLTIDARDIQIVFR